MKKLIAVVLSLVMVMSMSSVAFADDTLGNGSEARSTNIVANIFEEFTWTVPAEEIALTDDDDDGYWENTDFVVTTVSNMLLMENHSVYIGIASTDTTQVVQDEDYANIYTFDFAGNECTATLTYANSDAVENSVADYAKTNSLGGIVYVYEASNPNNPTEEYALLNKYSCGGSVTVSISMYAGYAVQAINDANIQKITFTATVGNSEQ